MSGEIVDARAMSKQYAKELYFKYYSVETISKMTNLPYGSLKRWVYKGVDDESPWKTQRKELEEESLKAAAEARLPMISEITGMTLVALREGLNEYIKRGEVPEISDMAQLASILERVVKLSALVQGEPTEITETRTSRNIQTLEDVKEVMLSHPFFEVRTAEDVEVIE